MREVGGGHQAVQADVRLGREMVKHQRAAAETVGASFKSGTIGGERIEPAIPGRAGFLRNRRSAIVFAVVEDKFEAPVGRQRDWQTGRGQHRKVRHAVAVEDAL